MVDDEIDMVQQASEVVRLDIDSREAIKFGQ